MDAKGRPAIRLYQDDATDPVRWDAHKLAAQELLRPVSAHPSSRDLEPFSRAWFEALELKRYTSQGAWLHRILEFTRHTGETLLMLGAGLGSDAVQYQRHGVDVTLFATQDDPAALIQQNFHHRGLSCNLLHGEAKPPLPFQDNEFDLAYLNLVHLPGVDLTELAPELYRILKPGGKVFVLAPAKYDVNFWQYWLTPYRRWFHTAEPLSELPAFSGRMLRNHFPMFTEPKLSKRHLRTSDLPYIWRFAPLALLERLLGRVIALRAFKPLSAALEGLPNRVEKPIRRLPRVG